MSIDSLYRFHKPEDAMNAYQVHHQHHQQQQLQMAYYQQQQMELAQQHAQLEMQLQLEKMRLQNLALQEQIMLGQAAQAQAQAGAQQQQQRANVYQPPSSAGRFAPQGGVLAERALARRQQQAAARDDQEDESVAPAADDQVSPLRRFSATNATAFQTPAHQQGHHRRASSTSSYLSSPTSSHDPNAPTPALVLSKPGETFPTPAPAPLGGGAKHRHTDSGSSTSGTSTRSSLSSFMASSRAGGEDTPSSEIVSFGDQPSGKQQRSPTDEIKWRRGSGSSAGSPSLGGKGGGNSPKLNPCSSVFVPGAKAAVPTSTSPPVSNAAVGVYRPRAGSPPNSSSSPALTAARRAAGAVAVRQPKGPPTHEADLASTNFSSRIRRRAVDAIRALGVRVVPGPTSPVPPGYDAMGMGMGLAQMQQQQQGFVERPLASPGLTALVAATRAREERLRQQQQALAVGC